MEITTQAAIKLITSNIPANVTAVVISADPFFQDTMDDLIDAANDWVSAAPAGTNRYVVYPVSEYENKDGDPSPTKKKATLFGPDLRDAYQQLGQQAKYALGGSQVYFHLTTDVPTEIK